MVGFMAPAAADVLGMGGVLFTTGCLEPVGKTIRVGVTGAEM